MIPQQVERSIAARPESSPLSTPPDTLVLGLGNPLMGDDGVGIAALERLAAGWGMSPAVRLLDGGTSGLQLLPHIEESERVVLVDAIEVGAPAGRLVVLERDGLPRFFAHKLSPHEIGLREVLALAELRDRLPGEIVAIGLQPGPLRLEPGLCREVEAGLDRVVDAIVDRLRRWGHVVSPLGQTSNPGSPSII